MRYSSAFNPSVTVEVEHPPGVGFVVEEVVFAEESGARGGRSRAAEAGCEAEWVQVLTEWLVDRGVRVGRRGDERYADAVIAVNVTRCETEQDRSEGSKEIVERVGDNTRRRTVTEHHARTRVTFRATFEVTDLSTGLVAASRTLAYEPETTVSSVKGLPEFPSPGVVARRAYEGTIDDVAPFVFGWVDKRRLVFFDDERCGLNLAHRAVKSRDYERALEISIANAGSCEPDPGADITGRDVAAAHYNVGVLYLIQGDFDSAMASLERARAADPGNGLVREAIRETVSAEAVAAELRRVEDEAAARDEQRRVEEESILRNADIVAMVKDGLADQVILEVIRTSAVDFDVSPATLAELAEEGLSAAVIAAMVRRAGGSDPEAGIAGGWRRAS
ncbi:MAG: tetratricopeptide repeat protein [Gemmatimonadota bacterium]|nr:tetratricopeptide repeat protein [Gemmatimonadota bacterium]